MLIGPVSGKVLFLARYENDFYVNWSCQRKNVVFGELCDYRRVIVEGKLDSLRLQSYLNCKRSIYFGLCAKLNTPFFDMYAMLTFHLSIWVKWSMLCQYRPVCMSCYWSFRYTNDAQSFREPWLTWHTSNHFTPIDNAIERRQSYDHVADFGISREQETGTDRHKIIRLQKSLT